MLASNLNNIIKMISLFSMALFYINGHAANLEPTEHITTVTKNFILNHVETNPDESVDVEVDASRLKLAKCSNEISASLPSGGNHNQISSVELTCDGSSKWHIFVPVNVQVNTKVVVAKKTLLPNDTIKDEDLDYTMFDKKKLYNGYYSNKQQVIGTSVNHLTQAGTVLTSRNTQLPVLVHNSRNVTIIARSNAVSVSMQGIARSNGTLNAIVKVENPSSKRIFDAVVVGPNKAEIVS